MTDVRERQDLGVLMTLIDQGIADMRERQLVATSDVTDLLLDLRLLLVKFTVDEDDIAAN